MIKIFLTGALSPLAIQANPSNSIGDYLSSSEVVNGSVDYLFGGISELSKMNTKPEYCLIAIKNVGSVKNDLVIKPIIPEGCASTMEIAVVEPSTDDDGNIIFEKIQDRFSQPYYADFVGEEGFSLPKFKKNAVYGIWLMRTVIQQPQVTNDQLIADFQGDTPIQKEDDIMIEFTYSN